MSVDGGDVLPLGIDGGAEMVPDIAPDGETIAFTADRKDNVDLYALSLGDRQPGRIDRLTRNEHRDVLSSLPFLPCLSLLLGSMVEQARTSAKRRAISSRPGALDNLDS